MSFKRLRLRRTRLFLLPVLAATLLSGPARADEAAEIAKLMHAGQGAEALKRADAYLARVPRDAQVRFLKGVMLSETKPAEAIAIFAALTQDYPRLPEPYNNLAVLYAASGQYEKASAALDKAMRTNPAYATAYQNLGDVHARLASLEYEKALRLDPGAGEKVKLTLMQSLGGAAAAPSLSPDARAAQAPQQAKVDTRPVEIKAPPAKLAEAAPAAAVPTPAKAEPLAGTKQDSRPQARLETKPEVKAETRHEAKPEGKPEAKPEAKPKSEARPVAGTAEARPAAPAKPAAAPTRLAKADKAEKTEKTERIERNDAKARAAQEAAAERGAVMNAVASWARAWSERDVPAYLAHYAPDFEPGKGLSRKDWAEERRARIVGKGRIEVRVEKPQVEVAGNSATVRFHQVYVSDRLSASSRKTLMLSRQRNGKWQITRESTG